MMNRTANESLWKSGKRQREGSFRNKWRNVISWAIVLSMAAAGAIGGGASAKAAGTEQRPGYTYFGRDYVDTGDSSRYGTTGDGTDYAQAKNEKDTILSIPLTGIQAGQYEIRINYSYRGETTYANMKVAGTDDWFAIPGTDQEQWDVFRDYAFDRGGFTYTGKAKTYTLTDQDTIEIIRGGEWIWIHSVELVPTATYEAIRYSTAETAESNAVHYVHSEESQEQLVEIPLTGLPEGQYTMELEYSYYGEATFVNVKAEDEDDHWFMIPGTSGEEFGVFGNTTLQENDAPKVFTLDGNDVIRIYRGGKDETSDSWIWLSAVTLEPVAATVTVQDTDGSSRSIKVGKGKILVLTSNKSVSWTIGGQVLAIGKKFRYAVDGDVTIIARETTPDDRANGIAVGDVTSDEGQKVVVTYGDSAKDTVNFTFVTDNGEKASLEGQSVTEYKGKSVEYTIVGTDKTIAYVYVD